MDSTINLNYEEELLIACANTEINNNDYIKFLVNRSLNWDNLILKAQKHKLTPLLYFHLNKAGSNNIPKKIMVELKDYYNKNVQKNLMLLAELYKILHLFEKNDVYPIAYKGPVLALLAYKNLSFRHFNDIDLIVQPTHVKKAKKLLLSINFKQELELDNFQEKNFIKMEKEYKFTKKNGTQVDLHWKFSLIHFAIPFEEIINQGFFQTINVSNKKIRTLSPEIHILLLCIHNYSHRWSRLSLICDISEYIKQQEDLDWDILIETSEKLGITKILYTNLYLAKNILNLSLPNKISSEVENQIISLKILPLIYKNIFSDIELDIQLLEQLRITFKLRDNFLLSFKDVLTGIFVPSAYDWERYPLPSKLSFLYYFARPFIILLRYKL